MQLRLLNIQPQFSMASEEYTKELFFCLFWQNHFYHLWDIICFCVHVSATSKVSPMHRYFFSPITCHHMPIDYVTFTNWISLSLLLHPYVLCYCFCSHVSTIKPWRHYNFWMDSWSSIAQYTFLLWAHSCAFCAWWNYSLSFRLTFRRQLLQIFPPIYGYPELVLESWSCMNKPCDSC